MSVSVRPESAQAVTLGPFHTRVGRIGGMERNATNSKGGATRPLAFAYVLSVGPMDAMGTNGWITGSTLHCDGLMRTASRLET